MSLKNYINPDKSKTFAVKKPETQKLINHTLYILDNFGVPVNGTDRRIERMAIAFLAIADIKKVSEFPLAKNLIEDEYSLTTREIIDFVNDHFQENISRGSYDDIRRKDLKLLVAAGIALKSIPNSATNDSTRGYGLNPHYAKLLKGYPHKNWNIQIKNQLKNVKSLAEKLKRERNINKVPVQLSSGEKLESQITSTSV